MQTWTDVIVQSFQNVWAMVIGFLPSLVAALVILIVGLIIAAGIGGLVKKLLAKLLLDKFMEKTGVVDFFKKIGLTFTFSGVIGWLVKWILIIIVLIATFETLGLTQVINFLNQVVTYLPNVVVAVLILFLGIAAANFIHGLVIKAIGAAKFAHVQFLAGLAKWAIVIFSFMAALMQLGIAASLVNTLFTGFVAMLAIAGGLAFGLGGKDWAQNVLAKLKKDITGKGE